MAYVSLVFDSQECALAGMQQAGASSGHVSFVLFMRSGGWRGSAAALDQLVRWLAEQDIADSGALVGLDFDDLVGSSVWDAEVSTCAHILSGGTCFVISVSCRYKSS